MSVFGRKNLKQKAVLWAASTADQHGRPRVIDPVEVKVRWEDTRRESNDPQNLVVSTDITIDVDREVTVESVLWLGELVDLPAAPSPLYKVIGYDGTQDMKGRKVQHSAVLARYGGSLPTIAG